MPEPSPYPSNLVISNLKKNVVVKLFSYLSFTTLVNLDLRCENPPPYQVIYIVISNLSESGRPAFWTGGEVLPFKLRFEPSLTRQNEDHFSSLVLMKTKSAIEDFYGSAVYLLGIFHKELIMLKSSRN